MPKPAPLSKGAAPEPEGLRGGDGEPAASPPAVDPHERARHEQLLMGAVGFTQEQLDENRQGRIAAGQRRPLLGWAHVLMPFFISVTGVLATGLPLVVVRTVLGSRPWPWDALRSVLVVITHPFFVWAFVRLTAIWVSECLEIYRGPVISISGRVVAFTKRVDVLRPGRGHSPRFRIGGVELDVPWEALGAVCPTQNYRVYFTPRIRRVLSIEVAE